MLTFKQSEDINKLSPDDPAYATVKELIEQLISAYSPPGRAYDAEDDGYVSLVSSKSEVNGTLDEPWEGASIKSIPWEGIMKRGDFYIAIYLANNEWGWTLVIPTKWVTSETRKFIESILDPLPTDTQENIHEKN
jgi:hypothetical protein